MSYTSHMLVRSKRTFCRGLMRVVAVTACLAALHADSALADGYPFPGTLAVLEPASDSQVPLGFLLNNISCDPETGEFTADASAFLYGFVFFWTETVQGTVVQSNFVWKFSFSGLGDVFIFGSGRSFEWLIPQSDGTFVGGPVNMF